MGQISVQSTRNPPNNQNPIIAIKEWRYNRLNIDSHDGIAARAHQRHLPPTSGKNQGQPKAYKKLDFKSGSSPWFNFFVVVVSYSSFFVVAVAVVVVDIHPVLFGRYCRWGPPRGFWSDTDWLWYVNFDDNLAVRRPGGYAYENVCVCVGKGEKEGWEKREEGAETNMPGNDFSFKWRCHLTSAFSSTRFSHGDLLVIALLLLLLLLLPLLLLLLYRHHNLLLVLPSLCISLATGHRSDSVCLNATFDSASNLKRMRRPDTLVNSVIKQLRWSASGLAISFCDIDADAVTWRALRSYRRRQLLMASSALTWEHVLQIDFLIKLGIRISPNV